MANERMGWGCLGAVIAICVVGAALVIMVYFGAMMLQGGHP